MNLRPKGGSPPAKGEYSEVNVRPHMELQWADYEAVGAAVYTLELLRAGDHARAIGLLEAQLDRSLGFLTGSICRTPETDRDPLLMEMVQKARDYRTKFPHPTGPIAEPLAQRFSSIERRSENSGGPSTA
jgi:hypothetical protein